MSGKLTVHKALIINGLHDSKLGMGLAINEARCYANTNKVHEKNNSMVSNKGNICHRFPCATLT